MYAKFYAWKQNSMRIMLNTVSHAILLYFSETWIIKKESSCWLDLECLSAILISKKVIKTKTKAPKKWGWKKKDKNLNNVSENSSKKEKKPKQRKTHRVDGLKEMPGLEPDYGDEDIEELKR